MYQNIVTILIWYVFYQFIYMRRICICLIQGDPKKIIWYQTNCFVIIYAKTYGNISLIFRYFEILLYRPKNISKTIQKVKIFHFLNVTLFQNNRVSRKFAPYFSLTYYHIFYCHLLGSPCIIKSFAICHLLSDILCGTGA